MKAQRCKSGVALLFLNLVLTRGWVVNATLRALYPRGRDPVSIVLEAGWAQGPVWTSAKNLAPPPAGLDPRDVQSVASRYTACAILAHR